MNVLLFSIIGSISLALSEVSLVEDPNKHIDISSDTLVSQTQESPPPVRHLGYIVEFEDCLRTSEERVECSFFMINESNRRRQVYITDGIVYTSEGRSIRQSSRYFLGRTNVVTFPSNVPMRGIVVYEGVPRNTSLAFMEIHFSSGGERFIAEYRL